MQPACLFVDLYSELVFETGVFQPTSNKWRRRDKSLEPWTHCSLDTGMFVYMRPKMISPEVMTALWWQPLKPDPPVRHALLVTLSWPTTAAGLFLPWLLAGLAWRQSPGSGELGGWQGHRCHLPLNLPHPTDANRHLGTRQWKHCHGVLHWQNRITEMLLFSCGSNEQNKDF